MKKVEVEKVTEIISSQLREGVRSHYFQHVSYSKKLEESIKNKVMNLAEESSNGTTDTNLSGRINRLKLNLDRTKMVWNRLDDKVTSLLLQCDPEKKHLYEDVISELEQLKELIVQGKRI